SGEAGVSFRYSRVAGTGHGALSLGSDGSFRYTPNAQYLGADSFTYVVSDGTFSSNVATVAIVVQNAPGAGDASFVDGFNQAYSGSLASYASGPAGSVLTFFKVSDPSDGIVALAGNGSFTYTPNDGYTGTDLFTYQVSDGSFTSNIASVTINVQDPNPQAV